MKRLMVLVSVVAMGVMSVQASTWRPLGVPEMAQWGATHMLEMDYSDLAASTSTNTAATITVALPAKMAVEFKAMVLDEAFDTGNTNFTGSVAVKVGDGSTTDLYMASTETASDGTEVFIAYPAFASASAAVTPLTKSVYVAADDQGTNFVAQTVCTNASVAVTATALGKKYAAATQNIVVTLTPNLNEALADNTKGKIRFFFRLTEWRKK